MKKLFLFLLINLFLIMNTAYSENPIKVKTVYPPKCTLLKENYRN